MKLEPFAHLNPHILQCSHQIWPEGLWQQLAH